MHDNVSFLGILKYLDRATIQVRRMINVVHPDLEIIR